MAQSKGSKLLGSRGKYAGQAPIARANFSGPMTTDSKKVGKKSMGSVGRNDGFKGIGSFNNTNYRNAMEKGYGVADPKTKVKVVKKKK